MDGIEALNTALFLKINAGPDAPAALITLAVFLAKRLVLPLDLLLAALWLWGDAQKRKAALKAFIVTAFALVLNYAIGLAWPHPRPFITHLGRQLLPHAPTPSFPSDHLTIFAAVALCLFLGGLRRTGLAVFAAGLAVAWARIYLGVHFPLDMLGALGVSGLCYALIAPLWARGGEAVFQGLQRGYRLVLALPIRRHWVKD